MDNCIVQSFENDTQYFSAAKEGSRKVPKISLTHFVQNLIREYGEFNSDHCTIFADDVHYIDQKIFLSHIYTAEMYEWAIENPTRERAILEEELPHLQRLLDENCEEVFADWKQDMMYGTEADFDSIELF